VKKQTWISVVALLFALTGCSNIHEAAKRGDAERVGVLLRKGVPVYRTDDAGRTALHVAANKGQYEVVKLLLNRGASVDGMDRWGRTPLDNAARKGWKDIAALLIDNAGRADDPWGYRGSALTEAAEAGHKEIVELLIDGDIDVNALQYSYRFYRALHRAERKGHRDIVALLVAKGVDAKVGIDEASFRNEWLHVAAEYGQKDVVELLLRKGADVNARNSSGDTPLHQAARGGHKDVAALLIAKGADVNARDSLAGGGTPLLAAVFWHHRDTAAFLIAKGADVNVRVDFGWTALHCVAMSGKFKRDKAMLELLIASGAKLNARSQHHETPLDSAECAVADSEHDYDLDIDEDAVAELSQEEEEQIKDAQALVEFLKKHGAKHSSRMDFDKHLDGKWHSSKDSYPIRIAGTVGLPVLPKEDDLLVDVILIIDTFKGDTLTGAQRLAGGHWHDVVGELRNGVLHMKGGGRKWTMRRLGPATTPVRSDN